VHPRERGTGGETRKKTFPPLQTTHGILSSLGQGRNDSGMVESKPSEQMESWEKVLAYIFETKEKSGKAVKGENMNA